MEHTTVTDPRRADRRQGPVMVLSLSLLAITVVALGSRAAPVTTRIVPALLVTAAFALLAYALRAVVRSGALAGALVSFLLFISAGPAAFTALVTVFLLAWISTHLGYVRKQELGKAEGRSGRSAAQVLANLSVAAASAGASAVGSAGVLGLHGHRELWLIATAAALAEAAADTVSSECGEAWSDKVRLVTTWKRVAPGTDGGVSVPGTLAGLVGATLVACVCGATHLVSGRALPMVVAAAILGMFLDSLLGATFERWRLVGNNTVNFASTIFATLVAVLGAALWG